MKYGFWHAENLVDEDWAVVVRVLDNGRRTADDGRRMTDDGRWMTDDGIVFHCL